MILLAIICLAILTIIIYSKYSIYTKKIKQKKKIYKWFQRDANIKDKKELHKLSGWGYINRKTFYDTVDDWIYRLDPPIKRGAKILEMGCGVGAVLLYINSQIGKIDISGSDFSPNAIKKIKNIFPSGKFFCQDMAIKHPIRDNSQDHVISAGALGMYLYKDEMIIAVKEAVRMTKPGGSLCFTHFLEKKGKNKKSIIDKVDKDFWINNKDKLGIENIKFFNVKHQGDRYGFVCNKKRI